ncbi:16S rRNA (cytosine(1402)-N(4))-methyltransferase RsmH [Candidatus Wolfebacteria bacterium]|nr:16S rRNA (cytosine(1402)-N(4))-methyltransferase RsmH [Candidatus Wolfebacteria bacterium]
MIHIPVLLKEIMEILNPKQGEFFIDGTIDGGGHAAEILKRIGPSGKLLGIDLDEEMIANCRSRLAGFKNLILRRGNYADLPEILEKEKLPKADGLLLDLGFSSEQLESAGWRTGRGFSFLRNEPLDMRYNQNFQFSISNFQTLTAAEVINSFRENDLADIFWKYGEERRSRQIAKIIVNQRKKKKILTTFDLAGVIGRAAPRNYRKSKINPATRVFQALRIYVNDELGNLEKLLKNIDKIVKSKPGSEISAGPPKADKNAICRNSTTGKGRVGIISFHSLEDRIVKNYFKKLAKDKGAEILTKKPIRPSAEEINENPRSRSAKLRAIIMNNE